ncbi:MAG: hypothetical protein ACKOZT_13955 [Cyanobium sp.]
MPTLRPPRPPRSQSRAGSVVGTGTDALVPARSRRSRRAPPLWRRKRLWLLGLPIAAVAGLVAIAPPLPGERRASAPPAGVAAASSGDVAFRYSEDPQVYALDFDPRKVSIDLYEGWDREQQAYADGDALAFFSGPMYERTGGESSTTTVPLGDLKLGERVWRGPNRSAARQRAFVGIGRDGRVDFGYGELTPERAERYDSFIGGLHSVYNDLEAPPPEYKGAYSISMGQQIRYYLPRIRVIYGLRPDGRMEVLMSRDGLTLEQTRALARDRGLVAAYMPDHASKSRLIVPGQKGFSEEDANWISGGATSFVHVPYLMRLSRRSQPLYGDLLAHLTPSLGRQGCGGPLQCGAALGGGVADRALAGFNRLMEQGVEPLARLLWAPRVKRGSPERPPQRAPLREPVITADPEPMQQRQQRDLAVRQAEPLLAPTAPELPPPASTAPNPATKTPERPEAVPSSGGASVAPEAAPSLTPQEVPAVQAAPTAPTIPQLPPASSQHREASTTPPAQGPVAPPEQARFAPPPLPSKPPPPLAPPPPLSAPPRLP